jgi:hypothetical protein
LAARREIIEYLKKNDFEELMEAARGDRGIFRTLVSLSYDTQDIVSWRAIEAIGLIAAERAKTDAAAVRVLVQRILWMMREESGNNPRSAPDMLGEIVRNSPDEFCDIAPIIVSFHDEEILRRGVLRAVARIGEIRPILVECAAPLLGQYLSHPDAVTRYYAILGAGRLLLKDLLSSVEALQADDAEVIVYLNRDFAAVKVAHTAKETAIILRAGENE